MKIVISTLAALAFGAFVACSKPKLVEFRPVYATSENEYYTEERYPTRFFENIQQVLGYYDVTFKIEKGKVYISSKIYQDKELMFNYTKKALDQDWLDSHQ